MKNNTPILSAGYIFTRLIKKRLPNDIYYYNSMTDVFIYNPEY